ncbi:hypothetical protein IWQ60_012256 [Tieghemiomyces parasiticus]|uniref:Anaphase-promoting complex subunit 4 WD40 domain-containing protein n=1 Tax=Tieghemiomyces parasiticus TaxID=78921 RepID=A0A9W7ZFL1_9FUNG|nr:hypothetical protein IWQ60_012256 [Tieghemiomyces parasiticus]
MVSPLPKRSRSSSEDSAEALEAKKPRALVPHVAGTLVAAVDPQRRRSGLQAPTMQLTGATGEVLTGQFDPSGQFVASAGFDRHVLLWRTYGDCPNYGLLQGHRGPVLQVLWTADSAHLYSASTDRTLALWDTASGERVRRLRGHGAIVNCVARPGVTTTVASGSDDGTVRLWDPRERPAVAILAGRAPVTALAYAPDGDQLYAGGLDNLIRVWDVRQRTVRSTLAGHTDTVTGLALHPEGGLLLSYAMDSTARVWDVRPFAPAERCQRTLEGAPAGFERNLVKPAWSADGEFAATGGADRTVTVWDHRSGQLVAKLAGHKGNVNQVDFHPREPILLSASTDRTLLLGEYDFGAR